MLLRVVVQGRRTAIRRFDSQVVRERIGRDEEVDVARATCVADAGLHRAVAAAVDRDRATRLDGVGLGLDVDDAGRAQAIFGGQCTGDERDRLDQARVERLPEHADALGQDQAVDTVLQAVVLAANVELAERILSHLGRLQQHLVQLHVVAARHGVDRLRIERVDRGTGLGLDARARVVETLDSRRDFDALCGIAGLRRGGRGCSVRGRGGQIGRAHV